MGSCYSAEEAEKRVLILGLDNAGKSTILKGMLRFSPAEERNNENKVINIDDVTVSKPTQGFMSYVTRKNGIKIIFTDVGGAKAFRRSWKQFYSSTDILVYVIDCTDRRRLEETGLELHQLLSESQLAGIPLLIYANKSDVPGSLNPTQLSEALNIRIKGRNWTLIPSSEKTGIGIKEGLHFLLSEKTVKIM